MLGVNCHFILPLLAYIKYLDETLISRWPWLRIAKFLSKKLRCGPVCNMQSVPRQISFISSIVFSETDKTTPLLVVHLNVLQSYRLTL